MFTTTSKPAFILSSLAALVLFILSTPSPFTHSSTIALAAPVQGGYRYRDVQPRTLLGHQYNPRQESGTESPMLAQALSPSHANDNTNKEGNTERPGIEVGGFSNRQAIRVKKRTSDRLGARFLLRRQTQQLAAALKPGSTLSGSRPGLRTGSRLVARDDASTPLARPKTGVKMYRSGEEVLIARQLKKAEHFEGSIVKPDAPPLPSSEAASSSSTAPVTATQA